MPVRGHLEHGWFGVPKFKSNVSKNRIQAVEDHRDNEGPRVPDLRGKAEGTRLV